MSIPSAPERQVKFIGGVSIDGAPVAYVVVFAAVVTALSFIPFSITLGGGGGAFPVSQAILPLSGFILGPIAGAIANGIGTLIGIFVAPHTAGAVPLLSVIANMWIGFVAGTMVFGTKRSKWWLLAVGIPLFLFIGFHYLALVKNGVNPTIFMLFNLTHYLAFLLFILPTRVLFARWINNKNLGYVGAGLFLGTLSASVLGMQLNAFFTYYMFAWPAEVFAVLIPTIPVEHLFRCIVGTVIGTGVIAGLRAIGLVKAKWSIY